VETVILVGAKAPPETGPIRVFDAVGGCHELSRTALITSRGTWNASAQAVAPCLEIPKSLPKLGDFVEIRRGVECGKRDGNIIQVPEPGTHPLLRGEDVTPLQIQFGGLYLRRGQDRLKFKPLKIYGGPKLLVRRVTNSLIAAVDESDAHVLNTLYILSPRDGVEVSLWYLCGLLNSHLLNRYFQHIWVNDDRLFPYVRKEQLQGLPIPVPDAEAVAMVEDLARRLAAGETELKAELDAVVEKIYRRLA
jgi:hypothetical protein